MPTLAFCVAGVPQHMERVDLSRGRRVTTERCCVAKKRISDETVIAMRMAGIRSPIVAPLTLRAEFWFPFPRASFRKRKPASERPKTGMPDLKNLIWLLEDGMEGTLYPNDCRIVRYADVSKWLCSQDDDRPRTEVGVTWDDDF